jgi:RNA polymerase sigma-70 factor (ECF subfamily)
MQAAPSTAAAMAPLPQARAVSWAEMASHRAYLVNFARRRLLDPALAEDLVHDVFEAVATGRAEFGGRAAVRSWLVAILKHKIVDLVRQRVGHDSLDAAMDDGDEGAAPGKPQAFTCPQPRPDEVAEQRQLLGHVLQRIGELPATLRDAVELRLLRDQSTEDVCRTLAITEQNLFVRLHRARRALAA